MATTTKKLVPGVDYPGSNVNPALSTPLPQPTPQSVPQAIIQPPTDPNQPVLINQSTNPTFVDRRTALIAANQQAQITQQNQAIDQFNNPPLTPEQAKQQVLNESQQAVQANGQPTPSQNQGILSQQIPLPIPAFNPNPFDNRQFKPLTVGGAIAGTATAVGATAAIGFGAMGLAGTFAAEQAAALEANTVATNAARTGIFHLSVRSLATAGGATFVVNRFVSSASSSASEANTQINQLISNVANGYISYADGLNMMTQYKSNILSAESSLKMLTILKPFSRFLGITDNMEKIVNIKSNFNVYDQELLDAATNSRVKGLS